MLLIWMVYRVWGTRSCGRKQGQGQGHSSPQRTSASPCLVQHQTLLLWEVPTPNHLLWVPSCLPKSTWRPPQALSEPAAFLGPLEPSPYLVQGVAHG